MEKIELILKIKVFFDILHNKIFYPQLNNIG